jgi:hypothetical protein
MLPGLLRSSCHHVPPRLPKGTVSIQILKNRDICTDTLQIEDQLSYQSQIPSFPNISSSCEFPWTVTHFFMGTMLLEQLLQRFCCLL